MQVGILFSYCLIISLKCIQADIDQFTVSDDVKDARKQCSEKIEEPAEYEISLLNKGTVFSLEKVIKKTDKALDIASKVIIF